MPEQTQTQSSENWPKPDQFPETMSRPPASPAGVLKFADRHLGLHGRDLFRVLETLGYPDLEALLAAAVPAQIRSTRALDLPAAATEAQALVELRELASQNLVLSSMLGQGYYPTQVPSVITRNVMENPAWYTAYTPYQPEISQGRLELLLAFQTMISDLAGVPIANASMLDEATAVAEAVALMRRTSTAPAEAVLVVDQDLWQHTQAVLRTRTEPLRLCVVTAKITGASNPEAALDAALGNRPLFGAVLQYPGADGAVHPLRPTISAIARRGGLVTVAADLMALTLLTPPGEQGADVVVGSSQRFGVPMGFGGPHAGYLAVRAGLERALPGRIVGQSQSADGAPAYRLARQTREQHIRREKATSNICTAQALLAMVAALYAMYHGPRGLQGIARNINRATRDLAHRIQQLPGVTLLSTHYFDTLRCQTPGKAGAIVDRARTLGVNLWLVDPDHVQLSCAETTTDTDLDRVVQAFTEVLGRPGSPESAAPTASPADWSGASWPSSLQRTSPYLQHPLFHDYQTETELVRYLRRLADRDYALDRGMIPLGSCTMKLNATTELLPISWPEFSDLHPFAPVEQTRGSVSLIEQLSAWLAEITGYHQVSLQPNAGSQGELAGLLAIRAYHRSHGQAQRNICLIPASAHGTNAASAVLAGLEVIVIGTTGSGDIDVEDVRRRIAEHREHLAAIMITYPSTHGVFETTVQEVCGLIHEAGGQVYLDGANMNALVGVSRFAELGADVSHLNLHKTFCIPHGGGGPGVGPIGVREHLAPFLPGHQIRPGENCMGTPPVGPVAAASYGSAGILPISWAYLRLMGPEGLTRATATAIAAANYIATQLSPDFPVLFTGKSGLVAHECILDLREITASTAVTVDDVAKRLMDYGFHAPTMSFPVPGTLMIEPTESENLAELDRFCAAMKAIREEIADIAGGRWAVGDSPLRRAPHPAHCLVEEWSVPYSRAEAVYPKGVAPGRKYWPPVRRIDGAAGDRNLVCSCPPVADYLPPGEGS